MPETLVAGARATRSGRAAAPARDRTSRPSSTRSCASWVGPADARSRTRTSCRRRWGAEVWLKREDLAHTGAHKINNAIGQALLAKRLGAQAHRRGDRRRPARRRHAPPPARALGMPCTVYMGAVDMERQAPNVGRMKLLGADGRAGDQRRPDAARGHRRGVPRLGLAIPNGTYYMLGSAVGPHPYPYLVRELQSVIGREARAQMLDAHGQAAGCRRSPASAAARTPSACFIRSSATATVELLGIEAGGTRQRARTERRDARLRHARRAAGQRTRCCCRTSTARSRRRIRSPPGSTTRASVPSTRCCCATGRVQLRGRRPTTRRSRRSRECCARGRHPAGDRVGARARRREALGADESRASES